MIFKKKATTNFNIHKNLCLVNHLHKIHKNKSSTPHIFYLKLYKRFSINSRISRFCFKIVWMSDLISIFLADLYHFLVHSYSDIWWDMIKKITRRTRNRTFASYGNVRRIGHLSRNFRRIRKTRLILFVRMSIGSSYVRIRVGNVSTESVIMRK